MLFLASRFLKSECVYFKFQLAIVKIILKQLFIKNLSALSKLGSAVCRGCILYGTVVSQNCRAFSEIALLR